LQVNETHPRQSPTQLKIAPPFTAHLIYQASIRQNSRDGCSAAGPIRLRNQPSLIHLNAVSGCALYLRTIDRQGDPMARILTLAFSILLAASGLIAGLFLDRSSLNSDLLQMAVALILIVMVVVIAAYWRDLIAIFSRRQMGSLPRVHKN
jgi:hypothetical protein